MSDSSKDYILCESCAADDQIKESGVPAATVHCMTCEESQCEGCSEVHRKQKLTKDHYIVPIAEKIQEKLSKMKETSKSEKKIIFCDICDVDKEDENDEVPTATMFCINCQESQCASCSKVHRKQKLSKTHNIVTLAEIMREKVTKLFAEIMREKLTKLIEPSKSEESIIFCDSCNDGKENENDEVSTATMFCTTCEESQCDGCSKVHRKQKLSKDHNIVSLTEQMKEKLNKMKKPSQSDEEIVFCDSTDVDNENDDKKQEKKKFQETPRDLMLNAIKHHKEIMKGLVDETAGKDKILNVKPRVGASKAIWGVAKINDEVFLLRDSGQSSAIYKWQVKKEIYQYLWKVHGNPLDMTGDSRNRRLYISRCIDPDNEIMISVHDINESGSPCEIPKHSWRVCVGRYATLSVTAESNILLTLMERRKLVEYSHNGADETIYREIAIDDIANPLHAVKQSSDTYVVCHGENRDEKHRVCIVNAMGHMLKEFCLKTYSDVKISVVPMYLALGSKGSIIVAENRNGQVVKLNADLTVANVLQTIRDGMRGPCRLHLDDTSGKIIVVSNGHGWSSGKLTTRDVMIN